MCYVARTWQLNDLHKSTVAIPWQLPHLLHNRNYSKTRPLKLISFSHYSFSLYRPDSFYPLPSSFFFFWHALLNYRLQFINTIWKEKTNHSRKKRKRAERSTSVTNKAVMAFLLGKLEQLFCHAHFFSFFLGEIQILEQQQNLGHQSQRVYGN